MARIDGKKLIGVLGPTILTNWRDKQVVKTRPAPGSVKQSLETRNVANVFGLASSFGAYLRGRMNLIHFIQDGDMVNRMNVVMAAILRKYRDKSTGDYHFQPDSFKPMEDFELNINSPLKEHLLVLPEVNLESGKLKIRIPEFDVKKSLKFPPTADSCTIIVSVQMASLKTGDGCYMNGDMAKDFSIKIGEEKSTAQEWSYDVPEGCYCVTSMSLHYHRHYPNLQVSLNNKSFCPAMICDFSVNPGEFKDKPKKWTFSQISFEDGKHPLVTKKTRKRTPKNSVNSKVKGTKNEKIKAPEASQFEVLQQQQHATLQQNEALQKEVNELREKLEALESLIRKSNAPSVQPEVSNIAVKAAMSAGLSDQTFTSAFIAIPDDQVIRSGSIIRNGLSKQLNAKNRGKPAA